MVSRQSKTMVVLGKLFETGKIQIFWYIPKLLVSCFLWQLENLLEIWPNLTRAGFWPDLEKARYWLELDLT